MSLNKIEKDRLIEILFYYYFDNIDTKVSGTRTFWDTILNFCKLYNIDTNSIAKAVRILTARENTPTEYETYYLFHTLGLSVRAINKISKIYWQKQIAIQEKLDSGVTVNIRPRVLDIVIKQSMRDFVFAMYEFIGIFNSVDLRTLEDIF